MATASLIILFGSQPLPVQAHHAQECGDVFTSLSDFVVNGVNTNRSAYERAMNETGVPWQLLAAIHYRETGFSRTNPGNGQGIFQFVGGEGGPYPPGPVSDDEFYRQLKFMANKVQDDYVWRGSAPRERRRLQPNEPNAAIVKDTLFSYNGRADAYADQAAHFDFNRSLAPYEGSPYVMNRFDCQRARMGIITRDYGSLDGTDTRYGAFTIYARLRGDDYWHSLWSAPFAAFGNAFIRAKSNDPNDPRQWVVYLNIKQWIPSAEIIYAWGLQNTPLVTYDAAALNSIPSGPQLGRLMRQIDRPELFLVDNGRRHWIQSASMLEPWGLGNEVISSVSSGLASLPQDAGPLTYAVRQDGTNTVYLVDGTNGNGQTVLRVFPHVNMLNAWEGENTHISVVSADMFDRINDAISSPVSTNKIIYNNDQYMVLSHLRLYLNAEVSRLFTDTPMPVSAATFQRLVAGVMASQFIRVGNTPTVYMVDNNTKRPVASPSILQAWANGGNPLVNVVNGAYANLLPTGDALSAFMAQPTGGGQRYLVDGRKLAIPSGLQNAYGSSGIATVSDALLDTLSGAGDAKLYVKARGNPAVYLLENGVRRQFTNPTDFSLWANGANQFSEVASAVTDSFAQGNNMNAFVAQGGTNYLIDGGARRTVNAAVTAGMGLADPATVSADTLNQTSSGSALTDAKLRSGDNYYLLSQGTAWRTQSADLASLWQLTNAPEVSGSIINKAAGQAVLNRFVRSTDANDQRIFTIDGSKVYHLTSPELVWTLGFSGTELTPLAADQIAAKLQPSAWQLPIVKSVSGAYYVLDGGLKRPFASTEASNAWTNSGQLTVPTLSDSYLNLLPLGGPVGKSIKGASPAIYAVINGQRRWVQSSQTYTQQYSPFMQTSEWVVGSLPEGSAIP